VRLYRLIAHALRQPPEVALPEDFAKQVAARVAASPVISGPAAGRIESILLAVLFSVLFVSAEVALARGESSWLPAIHAGLLATDSANKRIMGLAAWAWKSYKDRVPSQGDSVTLNEYLHRSGTVAARTRPLDR